MSSPSLWRAQGRHSWRRWRGTTLMHGVKHSPCKSHHWNMFTALKFVSDLQAFSPLISTCCKLTSTQDVFLRSEAETCKAYLYSYPGAVLPLNAEADEITGLHRPSGTSCTTWFSRHRPRGAARPFLLDRLWSTLISKHLVFVLSLLTCRMCVCAPSVGAEWQIHKEKHKHRLHTLSWDLPPSIQENSGK